MNETEESLHWELNKYTTNQNKKDDDDEEEEEFYMIFKPIEKWLKKTQSKQSANKNI